MTRPRFAGLRIFFLAAVLSSVSSLAGARPLALPVRDPQQVLSGPSAPSYAGDVLEIRLSPRAARSLSAAQRISARLDRFGLPAIDAASRGLGGVWFEPEFRGEVPPPPGSNLPDFTTFWIAHLPPGAQLEDARDRFEAAADVQSVSPIPILNLLATPNDSLYGVSTWFFQPSRLDIHAPEAWDVTTGDTSIVVAVLDSGVLPYHPDLGGRVAGETGQMWSNWGERGGVPGVDDDGNGFVDDVRGWDFVNVGQGAVAPGEDWRDEDNDPNDFVGHGTALAGLIGALSDNVIGVTGTAWQVRIMPLRIGYAYPGSSLGAGEVRMDFVAKAVRYATRMGASVINCSFESLDTDGLGAAVDAATRAGVVVVVAAGNRGGSDPVRYLGSRSDAITVSAVDSDDDAAFFASRYPEVDLSAPGVQLASTWLAPRIPGSDSVGFRQPAYAAGISGTSYAAPLVSGAAALMQARQKALGHDPLHPMAALLRLTENADDLDAINPLTIGLHGSGRLNMANALGNPRGSTATRLGGAVVGAPLVLQTNSGGARIAIVTSDRRLVILGGQPLDTLTLITLDRAPIGGIAAARLVPGTIGLFVPQAGGFIDGFDALGAPLPGWPVEAGGAELSGSPAVADIDGAPGLEIVCGTTSGEVWAWHAHGGVVNGFPVTAGLDRVGPVALAAIDSVPGHEIVAITDGGRLRVFKGSGSTLWNQNFITGELPSAPVIARAAPSPRLVVAVAMGAALYVFDARTGSTSFVPIPLPEPVLPSVQPALADINGDGFDEMILATESSIAVIDQVGTSLPGWPRPVTATSPSALVLGHLVDTAQPELLFRTPAALRALTSQGDSLPRFPRPGVPAAFPTLTNLGIDSRTEVVVGSADSLFCLYVYDAGPLSWSPAPMPWPTARGNHARTGSTTGAPTLGILDLLPPAAVTTLQVEAVSPGTVRLLWTAPGDNVGATISNATAYDVRRSTAPLTDATFDAATAVGGTGVPKAPGAPETLLVNNVPEGLALYVALRSRDASGNTSLISNSAVIAVAANRLALRPAVNPSRLPLAIAWHAAPGFESEPQVIRIYDLQGRLRKTLGLGTGAGGVAPWDGRDERGNAVPAGLYFLRLSSGRFDITTRVALLP